MFRLPFHVSRETVESRRLNFYADASRAGGKP